MATNTLENTSLVVKWALKRFLNNNVLADRIDRQLDQNAVFGSSMGMAGKPGQTAQIRRPVYFVANDGATLVSQDIEEGLVTVTLTQRKHVAFELTSAELSLEIEDADDRYIRPAMEELSQQVESSIAGKYTDIANFVGTPGTAPSTFLDIAAANVKLTKLGVPKANRFGFWEPEAATSLANGLKAVFVQSIAKKAIEEASFGRYSSFDNFECQSIVSHTVGALGGVPLVNGAAQNVTYLASKDTDSQTLNVDGWSASITDILLAGDSFTIAGVNSVNRMTRQDTGTLQDFTVLVDATSNASGETALLIAPAIVSDSTSPYQNVTAAPADGAAVTVQTGAADSVHPQNLTWHKNALTLATGPLDLPSKDGASAAREEFKGISMRAVRQYDINVDKTFMRFDILYEVVVQNRGFACRVTS